MSGAIVNNRPSFQGTGMMVGDSFKPRELDKAMADVTASGADLSTVMLSAQIVDADRQASAVLSKMQKMALAREVMQQRVDDLMLLKGHINAVNGKDNDRVGPDTFQYAKFFEQHPEMARRLGYDPTRAGQLSTQDYDIEPRLFGAHQWKQSDRDSYAKERLDPLFVGRSFELAEDGSLIDKHEGNLWTDTKWGPRLTLETVGAASDRQKAAVSKLDSQKSLLNTKLQQLLQRKQQLVTMVSEGSNTRHKEISTAYNGMR